MESVKDTLVHKESFSEGFKQGYEYVLKVLDTIVEKETHLNPHVKRVLNEGVTIISETLKDQLPNVLRSIYNA